MKIIFLVCVVLFSILLILIIHSIKKKHYELHNSILRPLVVGFLGSIFYTLFLFSTNHFFAVFFDSLYFMCTDFMTLTMMTFSLAYTGVQKKIRKRMAIGFSFLVICDSLSLFINNFTHHLFDLIPYYENNILYWHLNMTPLHYLHLMDCYILVIITFVLLIRQSIISPTFYKSKNIGILSAYTVVLIANIICYTKDIKVDFSILLYPLLAIFICYFAIYSVPKLLLNSLLIEIYDTIEDIVVGYNAKGQYLYGNKKAKKLFQWEQGFDELLAEQYLVSKTYDDDEYDARLWDEEIDIDDKVHNYQVDYQKLYYFNKKIGSFLKFRDRTHDMNRLRHDRYIATHDQLTGLYNRRYYFERVSEEIKLQPDKSYYMLCSNIKDFRLINELFGQTKGNEVLCKQADLLRQWSHPSTIYGRIGDDKFSIFVAEENFEKEIFIQSIEAMSKLTESSIYQMHIFVGVYKVLNINEPPESMYDKAHMAIENIKDDYQTIFSYYNTDLMDRLLEEQNVIREFDKALKEHQFVMYLQAQVNPQGKASGAEALVRWQHPQKGLIFPGAFIPILENTGLIYKLDLYIWEEAAKKLADWKARGLDNKHISVNISAKDFYYLDIYQVFVDLVDKYNISPANLKIEITETVLMADFTKAMELFHKLQQKGFYIEIDDFGSGYSSLNMLKDINANVLKIDMGFLRETENQEKSRVILETIITMSKQLNMTVITEGVETIDQANMLTAMGCDLFQGYYYSKPIPVADFEEKFLS